MSNKPFTIGLAGLGTVGLGVVKVLEQNRNLIATKVGREIKLKAVSARNKNKVRGVNLDKYEWVDELLSLPDREDLDAVVEVIGGTEEPSKSLIEKAIKCRKHVVTANKALLAMHGHELATKAECSQLSLRFEAAVAGGIPIIKALMEGLASNKITKISGVMNGTCNYILSRMEATNGSYEEIFSEAQNLGYVEADPSLDVGGIDAAQKLAILSSIAFQSEINFNDIEIEGIEQISLADIQNAKALGYRIKLIGTAELTTEGIYQGVQPCLVPKTSAISKLEGGTNMITIDSDFVGQTSFSGPGAGSGPTASAVVADLIDIAQGKKMPVFGLKVNSLKKFKKGNLGVNRCYYIRLSLVDRPGALAKVATILGKNQVSIDRMRQTAHDGDEAPLLIVTHKIMRPNLNHALSQIENLDVCLSPPVALRIEEI